MLKISSIKSLTSRRNKRITFRYKSIYRFLHDMSLHGKGLLNSSEDKNKILYKARKCYLNKNTNFTLTKLSPQKNVYKRAGATINLTHLTHKEQQFSKPFLPVLFSSRGILTISFINQCNATVIQETIVISMGKMFKKFRLYLFLSF